MAVGRVLIAGGNPLAASPTWARYDNLANCRCSGWDVTTGRSGVFEHTDVGTATVHFHDREHVLNTTSLIGRAVQLQILDPVTAIWEPSFRGVVDEATFDVYPLTPGLMSTVQLRCVDMFAYLSRVELTPGIHGDTPAHGYEGSVVYGLEKFQDRLTHLFLDADVPSAMFVAFEGNVWVWDVAYDAGESVLVPLRDTVDAEFPGVGNIYCDRRGRVCAHGRRSRFDPEGTEPGADWTFTRWNAGDSTEIALTPDTAQIRELTYARPASMIYNTAIAWPKWVPGTKAGKKRAFAEKDKAGQVFSDATSISDKGYRAMPPMGDLLTHSNFRNDNTGVVETQKMAEYFVENYKTVQQIPVVKFKAMHPADPRAAATWALLTRIEISDVVNLTVTAAEFDDEAYFVEGWTKEVRPLTPEYDFVELTPNLSPEARYTIDPFEE